MIYQAFFLIIFFSIKAQMETPAPVMCADETPAPTLAPTPAPIVCGRNYGVYRPQAFRRSHKKRLVEGSLEDRKLYGPNYYAAWPWFVYMKELLLPMNDSSYRCGGSIVEVLPGCDQSDIVVTAAHCLFNETNPGVLKTGVLLVYAGVNRENIYNTSVWKRSVVGSLAIAPDYDDTETHYHNDLAVLKVHPPFRFGPTDPPAIIPICLKDEYWLKFFKNRTGFCFVAGVGWDDILNSTRRTRSRLLQTQVTLLDDEAAWNYSLYVNNASFPRPSIYYFRPTDNKQYAMKGDSGSPIMCQKESGDWELVGVVLGTVDSDTYPYDYPGVTRKKRPNRRGRRLRRGQRNGRLRGPVLRGKQNFVKPGSNFPSEPELMPVNIAANLGNADLRNFIKRYIKANSSVFKSGCAPINQRKKKKNLKMKKI